MNTGRTMLDTLIYQLKGKRWASALAPGDYHDLVDLWKMRVIDVTAKGKSITQVYVDIHNLWDRKLKIVIPAGTYFRSRGAHQNMVVRKESVLDIEPGQSRFILVDATCINATRPIPERKDHFRGVDRVPPAVGKFLKAAGDSSPMMVQAGVWSLTDGYSRPEIRNRLMSVSSGGSAGAGISESEIDSAAELLSQLGIKSPLTSQ